MAGKRAQRSEGRAVTVAFVLDTDVTPGDRMKQVSQGKQSDDSASLTRKAATLPPRRSWVGLWVPHLVPVLNKSIPARVPPIHPFMRFPPWLEECALNCLGCLRRAPGQGLICFFPAIFGAM